MRRSALLLLIAAMLAGCGAEPEDEQATSVLEEPWIRTAALPALSIPREAGGAKPEDPFSPAVLLKGRERYAIFCTPCHGPVGEGDGIIVERGYPEPPSLNSDRLRRFGLEEIVAVIAEGSGEMRPMAVQIRPAERWAIAAYVKALQLGNLPASEGGAAGGAQ